MPPGEGEIDLVTILSHMPSGIPIGVEVPMAGMTSVDTYEDLARRCRDGAGRVVAQVKAPR